ncbi:MAG TPA: hypothetical protein VGC42_09065 [Kofleriaceae bacterium]
MATLTLLVGCARPTPGRVIVVVTVDWEGAELSADGLDALDDLRHKLGPVPVTHFVSAAYFTKPHADPAAATTIGRAIRADDELAVHLHAWRSLVGASGVTAKLSPSFLTGTDQLLAFADGDAGFDTDLDAYSVAELRAMLRTSRQLLARTGRPVSQAFRAGGYLGTPKLVQAIADEGFTVDSSAIAPRQLDERPDAVLSQRLAEVWPGLEPSARPWHARPGVLELPIAALADYATSDQLAGAITAAQARLQAAPRRDVIVVIGCHLETASDFALRLADAIAKVPDRAQLMFATVSGAAARIHGARGPE